MFRVHSHVLGRVVGVFVGPARTVPAGSGLWPKIRQGRRHPATALASLNLCIRFRTVQNRCRGTATSAIWNTTCRAIRTTLTEQSTYFTKPRITGNNSASSRRLAVASADRSPCLVAFSRDRALPSGVWGPVDRIHGFTRWAADCRAAKPLGVSR